MYMGLSFIFVSSSGSLLSITSRMTSWMMRMLTTAPRSRMIVMTRFTSSSISSWPSSMLRRPAPRDALLLFATAAAYLGSSTPSASCQLRTVDSESSANRAADSVGSRGNFRCKYATVSFALRELRWKAARMSWMWGEANLQTTRAAHNVSMSR